MRGRDPARVSRVEPGRKATHGNALRLRHVEPKVVAEAQASGAALVSPGGDFGGAGASGRTPVVRVLWWKELSSRRAPGSQPARSHERRRKRSRDQQPVTDGGRFAPSTPAGFGRPERGRAPRRARSRGGVEGFPRSPPPLRSFRARRGGDSAPSFRTTMPSGESRLSADDPRNDPRRGDRGLRLSALFRRCLRVSRDMPVRHSALPFSTVRVVRKTRRGGGGGGRGGGGATGEGIDETLQDDDS